MAGAAETAALVAVASLALLVWWWSSSSSSLYAGLTAEPQVREVFKTAVAYPRRMSPGTPITVLVKHRCGGGGEAAHAEQTRKWV